MSVKVPQNILKTTFVLFLTFLSILFVFPIFHTYTVPMNDKVFNFSLVPEDGETWEGMNGWFVYKIDGSTYTPLEPDGTGGFWGLSYPGETFYYSRKLTQKLPDPILEIGVVNRNVAIFLDDQLLYTDCPQLENRIGALHLPMADYDKSEPLRVSLPVNYTGTTLTIAQSTPTDGGDLQLPTSTVWPCDVKLYCGYAYESQIIAETTAIMILAVVFGALGFFILFVSIYQAWQGNFDWTILLLPVFLFLNMLRVLFSASFSSYYFSLLDSTKPFYINLSETYGMLSFAVLYGFLAARAKKERYLFLSFAFLQCIGAIFMTITHWGAMPYWIEISGFLIPSLVFLLGIKKWREKDPFFVTFTHCLFFTTSISIIIIFSVYIISPSHREDFVYMIQSISLANLRLPTFLVQSLFLPSTILAVIIEFLQKMINNSNERLTMKLNEEAAQKHYLAIKRQMQQAAMLRHDMKRHFQMILALLIDHKTERATDYIQMVLLKTEEIRPIVHTGNYMIDNILNSRITMAEEKKIPLHVSFSNVLPQLPILDNDICSLLLNALDNAIEAAQECQEPSVLISLHQKNNFLCIEIINTFLAQTKKETTPEHGFGLQIMKHIIEKYQGVFSFEKNTKTVCLRLLLPISVQNTFGEAKNEFHHTGFC